MTTESTEPMVKVELQPNFADDDALKKVFQEAGKHSSPGDATNAIIKAWCKLARLTLKTGQHQVKGSKINGLSKVVEIEPNFYNSYGVKALEAAGIIAVTDKAAVNTTVSETHFEDWFEAYPARRINGTLHKLGKKFARVQFFSQIGNLEDYALLMTATDRYARAVKEFAKDPTRFLRAGFWREYLPAPTSIPRREVSPVDEVDGNEVREMMKRAAEGN